MKLGENHKKERILRCILNNRSLLIKYWTWSHIYGRFLPFWSWNVLERQYSCSGCLTPPSSLLAHKQLTPNLLLPQLHNAVPESSQWHPGMEIGSVLKKPKRTHKTQLLCKLPWDWTGWTTSDQHFLSSFLFLLLLCVLQSPGITESTFPALLSGAIAYFLYLDKLKRRTGVLAGSDSWCCFYGGRLTVNWIVPRVQSSALSTESFPSLHIPRVLTTSSHSSLQY